MKASDVNCYCVFELHDENAKKRETVVNTWNNRKPLNIKIQLGYNKTQTK